MTTPNKILDYLRPRPNCTGSVDGIAAYVKLPVLVVKHYLSALKSGGMVKRFTQDETDLCHLTMDGLKAANELEPTLAL